MVAAVKMHKGYYRDGGERPRSGSYRKNLSKKKTMMDPKQKSLLIKAGACIVALLGLTYMFSDDGEEEANEKARVYTRMVNKEISSAEEILEKPLDEQYVYDADGLIAGLKEYQRQLEENTNKTKSLLDTVDGYNDEPQSTSVVNECEGYLAEAETLRQQLPTIRAAAETLYERTLTEWQAEASKPNAESEDLSKVEKVIAELPKYKEECEKRRSACESGWDARAVYNRLIKKVKLKGDLLVARLDDRRKALAAASESREQVIGEGNVVDHAKAKVQEIDALLQSIRAVVPDERQVDLPTVAVVPEPEPEPEPEPDILLTATGDLRESLLIPMVEGWLRFNRVQPTVGESFVWTNREGGREIVVNVPAALQGAIEGKLCIRVVPVKDAQEAFSSVGLQGDVHLMLTGMNPNNEDLSAWLPAGQTLQQQPRSVRARVCYDALVFFRGNKLDLKTPLRSAMLKIQPTVFSVNDVARTEAANVFGLKPIAHDVAVQTNESTDALCSQYEEQMILGVWHKDAKGGLAFRDTPTICYAAGWESEEAFKNVPEEYLPQTEGIGPSYETITTGRYAYSYSIYAYRSLKDASSRGSELSAQLLSYMSNIEEATVKNIVKRAGFVPVDLSLASMDRSKQLTKDDLPLPIVLKKMGDAAESFGYDVEDTDWVYGVRIPFAMYFKTGSAEGGDEQVALDADSEYYTSTEAFARIQELVKDDRAAVVVLGHADVQHSGSLKVDRPSWKSNLVLSQKRSEFAGEVLKKKIPGNRNLHRVAVGTGWARPACDISLTKPIDGQENELARCRRAEVFIIFPVPGSGK